MSDKKIKIVRIVAVVIFVITVIALFYFSSQTDVESKKFSDSVEKFVKKYIGDKLTPKKVGDKEVGFRKYAHLYLYFILGISSSMFFMTFNRIKQYAKFVFPWAVCCLYSMSDEYHQKFVKGRSCEMRDLGFDCIGYTLGILLVFIIYYIYKFKKKKKGVL